MYTLMLFIGNQDKQVSRGLRRKKQNLTFSVGKLFSYSYYKNQARILLFAAVRRIAANTHFHGSPKIRVAIATNARDMFWQDFTAGNHSRLALLLCPMHA